MTKFTAKPLGYEIRHSLGFLAIEKKKVDRFT